MICSECNKEKDDIDQNIFNVSGLLDIQYVNDYEKELEEIELENGDIVYYYFDEEIEEIIRGNQNAAGKARSLCKECILDTIEKTFTEKDPHYCDGVYFSLHNKLNLSDEKIKACHGEYVANRTIRVKFKVIDASRLLKINKTGGVLKTNEGNINYLHKDLILANRDCSNVVKYLGIEEYKNGDWFMKRG